MRDQTELSALGASLLEGAERIYSDMQDWRRDFHQFVNDMSIRTVITQLM